MSRADPRDDGDDPFTILGVSDTCTLAELKQVYRELARRYHPDVNPGSEAAAQMKRINLAYNRALAQIERTARLHSARSSAMTVATERQQAPSTGISQVFGQGVRVARPIARRRGNRVGLWLSMMAGVAVIALIVALFIGPLKLLPPTLSGARTDTLPLLHLGGAISVSWQGDGGVTLAERLITQLPAGFRLNEAPEWSADGAYAAISVAPTGSNGAAASAASTILITHGDHIMKSLPGTSARWSPVANTLAILTAPGGGNAPFLELASPLTSHAPTILDSGAATHLAWSDDGTRIAYSANGQQQLRVASVTSATSATHDAPRTLVKTHGQRLIPLGWQDGQIIEIVHHSDAVSLVGVDDTYGQSVTLAEADSLASETTVAVSHDGMAYLSQPTISPFVTFHWLAPDQQWSAQLPGIQSARFLAGWSANGQWLALAPGSSADASGGSSEICLARAPHAYAHPPTPWPLHCVSIPGILEGMSWEPGGSALSYIRQARPGGALEFRALRMQSYSPASHAASRAASIQASRLADRGARRFSIITERSGRHYCGRMRHPASFSAKLAQPPAISQAPPGLVRLLAHLATASLRAGNHAIFAIYGVGCEAHEST